MLKTKKKHLRWWTSNTGATSTYVVGIWQNTRPSRCI